MKILKRLSSIFTRQDDTEIKHLTEAIDNSLNEVASITSGMDAYAIISSSTGEWLNLWGKAFYIGRYAGESDPDYRARLLGEVTNLKGTIPALIAAVKRALGDDTEVRYEETYQQLRMFNVSTYSGTGKYQDSGEVRLCVVKIFINKPVNDRLAEEIFKTKASGTRVIIEVE